MFSEYASRFLAQSQSRISSFRHPADGPNTPSRDPADRQQQRWSRRAPSRLPPSRSYLQRPGPGGGAAASANPYAAAASHLVPFAFASRASTAAPAPLFYSATDEFREEDDAAERDREVADFYALQRSRRQFGASRLEESSEVDDDDVDDGGDDSKDDDNGAGRSSELARRAEQTRPFFGRAGGIRSSWRGDKADRARHKRRERPAPSAPAHDAALPGVFGEDEEDDEGADQGEGAMEDIALGSTVAGRVEGGSSHPAIEVSMDSPPHDPPTFQHFRKPPIETLPPFGPDAFIPYDSPPTEIGDRPRRRSSESSIPPSIAYSVAEPPRHDSFWASLFLIAIASLFATFFLVYLHTSTPSSKRPLGDTVYSTLWSSFHLLAVDTLVAVVVSLVWLSLLRSFIRPLIFTILLGTPIVFIAFSIYPFVASFKGPSHGSTLQDRVLRWLSFVPAAAALFWTYSVFRARHSLRKATEMLEFGCRILAANSALLVLGFATLVGVVVWTWLWMGMFTRVFLGGHLAKLQQKPQRRVFVIDGTTWWLAVYFVLVYLWTLSVGRGIQRAATAATVSQWYFHRLAVPAPTSPQIVRAALSHACTTSFGSVCLSSLLTLLARLPVLLLPRRIAGVVGVVTYSLVPTSLSALTHPLSLTYAAIHSQPLSSSAKSLSRLTFLLSSSSVAPSSSSSSSSPFFLPYRLAKLLLHATRLVMTFSLGFGGWVSTAQPGGGSGARPGSLYSYVVGLIAAVIGWAVLGSIEGVIGGILDAALVCWASESQHHISRLDQPGQSYGDGGLGEDAAAAMPKGRYCLEANRLFGDG